MDKLHLQSDRKLVTTLLALMLVPLAWFAWLDLLSYANDLPRLRTHLLLRGLSLVIPGAGFFLVRATRTRQAYSRVVLGVALAGVALLLALLLLLPAGASVQMRTSLMILIVMYGAMPNTLGRQIVPPLIYSAGVMLLLLTRLTSSAGADLATDLLALLFANATGVVIVHRRAQLEQKVQAGFLSEWESAQQFRKVFEESPIGMTIIGLDGRFLAANRTFCEWLGYTTQEMCALRSADVTHPDDREVKRSLTQQAFSGEIPHFHLEHRMLRKNGEELLVNLAGAVVRADDGTPMYGIGMLEDITVQKRMENALKTSEAQLSQAMNLARLSYWELSGPDPAIATLNDRCFALLATTAKREGGYRMEAEKYVREFVHPDDAAAAADGLRRLWTGPSADQGQLQYRVLRRDGRLRYFAIRFEVLRDAAGNPVKVCGVTQDMTERVTLEIELRQAQKMDSIGRLAGGVAHDFNNLLTVINGYSRLLISRCSPVDPMLRQLQEIQKAGTRAAALTQQLLAFSRKQVIAPRAVDLNSVIHDIAGMLRAMLGEETSITTSLAPQLGTVLVDPDQMHQVIMNLAANARDAMPHGGEFRMETRNVQLGPADAAEHPEMPPGQYVLLAITDTGIGIDANILQSIFEPFFTTKERGRGTGLGLATVHGIVRQSDGWIQVHSKPGKGTTFQIYLPRTGGQPDVPEAEAAQPPKIRPVEGAETILVVEDQDVVRGLTVRLLAELGYRLLDAPNAEAALRVAGESGPIDLLITDVVMPGMTGPQLSERLLGLEPKMKVLYTSGHAQNVLRGVLKPGFEYLAKPFSPDGLTAKVRDMLLSRDRETTV
jgi:PAS domain S-box-containing protein